MNRDVDPWQVRESDLGGGAAAAASALTVANGHLGIRGSLDEAADEECRGTFLAGVHETHPLSYPEGGFGHPETGEAMIPVADGSAIRLLVDGVPLDTVEIEPSDHERVLDLRDGVLRRTTTWRLPAATVTLHTERLVSAALPGVAAIRWRVETEAAVRVGVRSQLVANAVTSVVDNGDPRVEEALRAPFEALAHRDDPDGGAFVHRSRRRRFTVGAAVRHRSDGSDVHTETRVAPDEVVTTFTADLLDGGALEVVKVLGYAVARDGEADEILEHARAAAADAYDLGWDELVGRQRTALDDLWERAGVVIEGDDRLALGVRFSIFHLWQASVCLDDAPLGAKGLTGSGYSGHTFWDIEGFALPALSYLDPSAAARLLSWRSGTLPQARERAKTLQVEGAVFAWRTISGTEVSAYWPASTAAMHLNADISRAYDLYAAITGHDSAEVGGFDVLVETARLWASLGRFDVADRWHLFGMTGPDEYTGAVDDNVFTNLMAARNLRAAADAVTASPADAQRLGVTDDEVELWQRAAAHVHVPFDDHLGVHPACTGFTAFAEWDFDELNQKIQENAHYFTIYRHQVVKQADLVQALWWCEDAFTAEQIARDLDYYEARTVRDSSLSSGVQAVVCARAGHLDLATAYWREAALVDLQDLQGNTDQGLHIASLAGAWLAMVNGFGGVRERGGAEGRLQLAPRLPSGLTRLEFRLAWRDHLVVVAITPDGATLSLPHEAGSALDVLVDGEPVTLEPGRRTQVPLQRPEPLLPTPRQPAGRAPEGR
ncbi:glycoside hydrolase family 65 protein [Mariniluteicoccus endophyticus]